MESKVKTKGKMDADTLAELKAVVGSGAEMVTGAAYKALDTMTTLSNMLGMDKGHSEALTVQIAMESGAQLIHKANKRNTELQQLHKECCKDKSFTPDEVLQKAIEGLAAQSKAFTVTIKRKEA